MFSRILIANRGEIAVRVIRTCRALGVETVAVHSDVDAGALHVRLADRAVSLGGRTPAESYLDGARLIAAARAEGAEAIHPGYGFLSENPDFVEQVEAAGLVFIGPSARAIRAMGLKDAAKAAMEAAGVPVVPGYHGADQADERLAQEAARIGWPVLVKAVAGGGGKGMRRVDTEAAFAEGLEAARGEARHAFGDDRVLIETFVAHPRHVEVQVFGDGTRALHLFERDCSLQRRHQKVIEEAPAPGMTAEMRAAMGQAAVRAAEAIGYSGAGTVEFIADGSDGLRPDRFWFMEMNTRLQVEHPVTEAVTGVDLVEWQLRVASGEPLPVAQEDLHLSGHAVEARLYAEDVDKGFLPATGRLAHLRFPDGVRADSGVETGDSISPHYDPMIAKLIAHGPDRATALRRLARGLDDTQVAGTVTNLAFLKALVVHPGFAAGEVDTGLIERDIAALTTRPAPAPAARAQGALIASGLWASPPEHLGFALWSPLAQDIALDTGTVTIRSAGAGALRIDVDGSEVSAEHGAAGWRIDGAAPVPFAVADGRVTLFGPGGCTVALVDALDRASEAATGDAVEAPMPGLVRSVAVGPGDAVARGDRLAVLEAMKMEHVLRAPRDGTVATVTVAEGDQVEAGQKLVTLEEEA